MALYAKIQIIFERGCLFRDSDYFWDRVGGSLCGDSDYFWDSEDGFYEWKFRLFWDSLYRYMKG